MENRIISGDFENRLIRMGALLTLLFCVVTMLLSQFTFVLDVRVDGERVGIVPDPQALEALIDTAEDAVTYLTGQSVDVAERVTYTLRLSSVADAESLDPQVVERGIFHHIDGVDMHYMVSIDGEPVGYVADVEALQAAMEQRIELLVTEGAISAAFVTELEYDFQLLDLEYITAVEDIFELVEGLAVETVEQVIATEPIPFEVAVISDDRRFEDMVEVLQEGMEGEMELILLATYIDGARVAYTIVQTKILVEAVPEILIEGTQVRPLTASWGYYIWPTEGTVSSLFGPRRVSVGSSNHQGIDISAPAGTPVVAADGGEVIFTGRFFGYGNLIRILHDNGHVTYYAHLRSFAVSEGDRVYRGQYIGQVGMTGTASGNHLHFEIRIDGVPVDPMPFLP